MNNDNDPAQAPQADQPEITSPPDPQPSDSPLPEEPVLQTVPEEPTLAAVPEESEEPETKNENIISSGSSSVNFNTFSSAQETPLSGEEPTEVTQPEKPKKKSSSSALVLLAIFLALCGVGFGVYGMFFQEPKTITKTIEVPGECETPAAAQLSSEYIYVGAWNIKIKKPASSTAFTTSFDSTKDALAVIAPEGEKALTGCDSLTILRFKSDNYTESETTKKIAEIDGWIYLTDTSSETCSADTLRGVLSSPDNYSKF